MKSTRRGARLIVLTACLLGLHAHAFQPHVLVRKTIHPRDSRVVLWKAAGGGNDESHRSPDDNHDKKAIGRAGGRRRRLSNQSNEENGQKTAPAVILFSLLLILVPFFDEAMDESPKEQSYYYYQSSYSETRVYSQDGSIQTSRKQSVETNVPSLLKGRSLLQDKRFVEEGYSRPSIEHDDF